MSAVPPPYERQASFTNFHTEPAPTVGQDLEAEFNAVKNSQDATQRRLAQIQRDDGALANLSVHPDALSSAVRALLTIDGEIRGQWAAGQVYNVGDAVQAPDGVTYLCADQHVANANFNLDLDAGRWLPIDSGKTLTEDLRDDIEDGTVEGPLRADLAQPNGAGLSGYTHPDTGISSTLKAFLESLWTAGTNVGADRIQYKSDLPDAVAATIQRKVRRMELSAEVDFGVVANGIADDTVAIEKAINSAGARGLRLIYPEGTPANPRILRITRPLVLTSGIVPNWIGGGEDKTIIRLDAASLSADAIAFLGAPKGGRIRGIRFDQNHALTNLAHGMLGFQNADGLEIEFCNFVNFDKLGLAFNGCRNWQVNHNKFTRSASIVAVNHEAWRYNQAFLISDSAQAVRNGEFSHNELVGSAIDLAGSNIDVHHNDIAGWGFGAGVTIEQTVNTRNNTVAYNRLHNSIAVMDENGYRPGGIENWGSNSALICNEIFSNAGAGIDQGGQRARVIGNICYNNGQHAPSHGIVSRYGDATYNASGSEYIANVCFDTQGTKTQTTSYGDQSALLSGLTFRGNQFNSGAGVTPESIISLAPDYQGPSLQSAAAAYNPVSVASGASITANITVPGALGGDFVDVSFDQDNQGCQFTGYVSATNQVTIVLSNLTGSAKDLASGFVRARVTKPMNYTAY